MLPEEAGRPPRGRGRPAGPAATVGAARTTPARAGTTLGRSLGRCRGRDDPRAGGDDLVSTPLAALETGRPPRGRGRRRPAPSRRPNRGTTPARAGTTTASTVTTTESGDDPRAGGDDIRSGSGSTSAPGRPPRGRGRRADAPANTDPRGTTPARAGTTMGGVRRISRSGDDPRAGGDDLWCGRVMRSSGGRPPRGRGRRTTPRTGTHHQRTTPARAGTTGSSVFTGTVVPDDPRAGGDDIRSRRRPERADGRPPRGRGRHRQG